MTRIAFIGAGSVVFTRTLVSDILRFPELRNAAITLMDIDAERLAVAEAAIRRLADERKARPTITATTDRRKALEGANYVISVIQVGGFRPATVTDFEIPKRFGVRQTIGDTLGIGGIMRALRTIPVLVDLARDMEQVCPQAWLLNHANPLAMNQWALARTTSIRTLGLCHSVPKTARQLADWLAVPPDEIEYLAAGINHMAFFLRLERRGQDLYSALRRLAAEGRVPEREQVRFEVLKRFGYFVSESSEHFAEYVPYFLRRARPDLVERYRLPLDEYLRRLEAHEAEWQQLRARLCGSPDRAGEPPPGHGEGTDGTGEPSMEFAPLIIHSLETGCVRRVYANVPNRGCISNLPDDAVVEVPCLVDATGVHPVRIGPLPPQLAALIRTNVNVQELTVEAALTGRVETVYHAAMLDPRTGADLTVDEITALVDELLAAHAAYLSQFAHAGGEYAAPQQG